MVSIECSRVVALLWPIDMNQHLPKSKITPIFTMAKFCFFPQRALKTSVCKPHVMETKLMGNFCLKHCDRLP